MKKIDIYFTLILISTIWLVWLIGVNFIQVNQVVYYYKPYPQKILLADKYLLYLYPIAFTLFIVYNFSLTLWGLKKRIADIINTFLFLISFFIFLKLFFLNY